MGMIWRRLAWVRAACAIAGGHNPADKDDSGAEPLPSLGGGGGGGGGTPIQPSAPNAARRSSIQNQCLSSLLLSSSGSALLSALVLAPAAQRQSSGLCLPPPHCHLPFDHRQKGISNDNGSVDEARDDSQTWGLASTPTCNNQMVKRAGGRQRDKRGPPT